MDPSGKKNGKSEVIGKKNTTYRYDITGLDRVPILDNLSIEGMVINPTCRRFKTLQFRSPHICLCVSEETLKAGGHFYLVSVPGEVKDHTQ